MKNITYLIALIFFALTILYSGCTTNADWGKYRAQSSDQYPYSEVSVTLAEQVKAFNLVAGNIRKRINNKQISQEELNGNTEQIRKEAQHLDLSVVSYLHAVNANKVKRVTASDLLPDPFLVSNPTKMIPRRTAPNKSFNWQGGVANVPNAKYIIKLESGGESETLYLSPSLEEARQYVRKYMPFHDDLYVYDKATGQCVYAPGNTFNTGWAKV